MASARRVPSSAAPRCIPDAKFQCDPGVQQMEEPVFVEALVAQAAFRRFDIGVRFGLPGWIRRSAKKIHNFHYPSWHQQIFDCIGDGSLPALVLARWQGGLPAGAPLRYLFVCMPRWQATASTNLRRSAAWRAMRRDSLCNSPHILCVGQMENPYRGPTCAPASCIRVARPAAGRWCGCGTPCR